MVLRLGHRYVRDDRVTTHLMLAARALGADEVIYTGRKDSTLELGVKKINQNWGGPFIIRYTQSAEEVITNWIGQDREVVHLTMYGIPVQTVMQDIRRSLVDKLIIVGGAKVHKKMFAYATWNVAVSSQPHSEISALSVFLHELFEGRELEKSFENPRQVIIPQAKGKKVIKSQVTDSV